MSIGSVFDDIQTVAEDVEDFASSVSGEVEQTSRDVQAALEGAEQGIQRERVQDRAGDLFSSPLVAAGAGAVAVALIVSLTS